MIDIINSLYKNIVEEVDSMMQYINENTEYNSTVFDTPTSFTTDKTEDEIKKATKELYGRKGVYVFLTTGEFDFTKERITNWNSLSGAKVNSQDMNGNMKPFSVKKHEYFYIGSCYSESLLTRIRKHCNTLNDEATASLKMAHTDRKWIKPYLKVYCFPIKTEYCKEKIKLHIIIAAVEHEFHSRKKTITGSSRT